MLRRIWQLVSVRRCAVAALGLMAFVAMAPNASFGQGGVIAVTPGVLAIAPRGAPGGFKEDKNPGEFDKMLDPTMGLPSIGVEFEGMRWKIVLDAKSDVKITGTSSAAALHRGMCIRFKGMFDSNHKGAEEVKDLEIFTIDASNQLNAAAAGAAFEEPGKKKNNEPKEWSVAGRIIDVKPIGPKTDIKKYKCKLDCGNVRNVTCEIAVDATIKINSTDPRLASAGDKAELDVIYFNKQLGYGKSVTIVLANNPFESAKKTPRGAKGVDKVATGKKPAEKSVVDAKPEEKKPEAAKPEPAHGANDAPFTSKEGRFSVQLPGVPQKEEKPEDPKAHSWFADAGGARYTAVYIDYPEGITADSIKQQTSDAALKAHGDGMAKSYHSRLTGNSKLTLENKWPGWEYIMEGDEPGGADTTLRMYFTDARQYVLEVRYQKGKKPADQNLKSFFDSFKLLTDEKSEAAPPAPPKGAGADAAKPFNSTEGRFTAIFPAEPQPNEVNLIWHEDKTKLHVFTAESNGVSFAVMYADRTAKLSPEDLKKINADDEIDGIRHETIQLAAAQPSKEKSIKLDNKWPGRELQFDTADGANRELICRIFMVETRQYRLVVSAPKGKMPADDVTKTFLDSFKSTAQ